MNAMSPALASRQRRSIIDDVTSGLGISRGAHISYRGSRWRLVNAAGAEFLVPTPHLDVIVIDANKNTSKLFFDGPYDPNNDTPPTCFSDNGTGPSSNAMEPQSPTCASCEWNRTGSATSQMTGKGIKACSDRKKIGVIIPGDNTPTVYELQIPPGSLTGLKEYTAWLSQQPSPQDGRKMDLADLVTRIEFDPDASAPKMKFSCVSYADDDYTLQMIAYIDANNLSDVAVGRNDVAYDPNAVQALLSAAPRPAALPPPASPPPAQQAQQFALPPRGVATQAPHPMPALPAQQATPPAAEPAAPAAPARGRGRGRAAAATQAPAATTAPFMAAAQAPAQPANPASPPNAPAQAMEMPGIPDFLKRDTAGGAAGAPPAPPQRFGIGNPPAPPANVQSAVAAAMQLPTRR